MYIGRSFRCKSESFTAKAYGCFQVDPNHFFSQLLNIIYLTTIYLKVNGTVVLFYIFYLDG
jgi:hypothetical protein